MIAAVLHAPRDLTIETRAPLAPGAGEAVIRVESAGLCGTDYRIWNGDRAVDYPRVMGHELVGRVLALGSGVSGLTPGLHRGSTLLDFAPCAPLESSRSSPV